MAYLSSKDTGMREKVYFVKAVLHLVVLAEKFTDPDIINQLNKILLHAYRNKIFMPKCQTYIMAFKKSVLSILNFHETTHFMLNFNFLAKICAEFCMKHK